MYFCEQVSRKEVQTLKFLSLISWQKFNVVGTQKNRLNETVLMSTQTYIWAVEG